MKRRTFLKWACALPALVWGAVSALWRREPEVREEYVDLGYNFISRDKAVEGCTIYQVDSGGRVRAVGAADGVEFYVMGHKALYAYRDGRLHEVIDARNL